MVYDCWISNSSILGRQWRRIKNYNIKEYVNKLEIKIYFTLAFSPWSNGVNERNHYSCDMIVKKVIEEYKEMQLQEAVHMASWTHNTNVNVLGYLDSLFDDDMV